MIDSNSDACSAFLPQSCMFRQSSVRFELSSDITSIYPVLRAWPCLYANRRDRREDSSRMNVAHNFIKNSILPMYIALVVARCQPLETAVIPHYRRIHGLSAPLIKVVTASGQ